MVRLKKKANKFLHPSAYYPRLSASKQGFTLLELLIVITIIVVLSVLVIIVLNPVETLRKSRDAQRISDLSALKRVIGIYSTGTSTPFLAGASSNDNCKTGSGGGIYASGDKIYYSYPVGAPGAPITDTLLDGSSNVAASQVINANLYLTDATGWLPINLDSIIGGSPISGLPVDPVNTIADKANVASTDLVYRYVCNSTSNTYEINAQLESTTFTVEDDKRAKDGGNNDNYFEVGTNLKILGTGTDF